MKAIDSRLLCVLEQIYQSRSVSAAAAALELGQPAASVALSKLRRHFGDPLFVRTSAGMEPTPFCETLWPSVRTALQAVTQVLEHRSGFEPTTSQRLLRICMTDISQLVLLPKLSQKLRLTAPGIRIEIMPLSSDTARLLESGAADLAIGLMPQLEAGFYQQLLFRQRFVCLVAQRHPRIGKRLTLAQFEAEDHAVVSSSGFAPLIIEREIARLGIRQRVVMRIPNFLGAAFAIEHTDLLATIPQRLGELLQGRGAFRIFPVPFALPEYDVKQHWHTRYHQDPGNQWLRSTVCELLSESASD